MESIVKVEEGRGGQFEADMSRYCFPLSFIFITVSNKMQFAFSLAFFLTVAIGARPVVLQVNAHGFRRSFDPLIA